MRCGKEHPGSYYYSIGNVSVLKLSGGFTGALYVTILYPLCMCYIFSMYLNIM